MVERATALVNCRKLMRRRHVMHDEPFGANADIERVTVLQRGRQRRPVFIRRAIEQLFAFIHR